MKMQKNSINWHFIRSHIFVFDATLAILVFLIMSIGIMTLYSAGMDFPGRVEGQIRNIMVSLFIMWVMANIPPQTLMRFAIPIYTFGVALLIAVAVFGLVKKGSRRWLHVGIDMQPSEMMKIATPLMLAWYFQKREGALRWRDFVIGAVILGIPAALIVKQPDLGTAMLVTAAGFTVVFLAGLSWKFLISLITAAAIIIPTVVWPYMLHDYQRDRVLTMLDPNRDPLGKGFHIIQSTIAVGSGGLHGKGYMKGTQAHLEFIPEHTTDFIFAVFSEEFGFVGNVVLVTLYFLLILRCLVIAANAPTLFSRLMAGAVTMIFFTYAFVNMGMVIGIVPVVGVPLPFMSYGGTALVTLGMGLGIMMSVQRNRKLVQT
ncbi:rod shape-determining protein RodA [Undibacterium sp. Ji42W]|uniref:rod shape-determining protein RodA n=1 Tax=Undibacterium sp. Ji42W TaxID=3413039 RepID=UPI003BF1BF7F